MARGVVYKSGDFWHFSLGDYTDSEGCYATREQAQRALDSVTRALRATAQARGARGGAAGTGAAKRRGDSEYYRRLHRLRRKAGTELPQK